TEEATGIVPSGGTLEQLQREGNLDCVWRRKTNRGRHPLALLRRHGIPAGELYDSRHVGNRRRVTSAGCSGPGNRSWLDHLHIERYRLPYGAIADPLLVRDVGGPKECARRGAIAGRAICVGIEYRRRRAGAAPSA